MSGVPVRVAVQCGAGAVRVAAVAADGEPWLLAELPAPPPDDVAGLLEELIGPPAPSGRGIEELVLVHPPGRPPSPVGYRRLASRVRAVPAPRAAAGLRWGAGLIVLDVGASTAEAVRLGPDGAVLARRGVDVGGRRLDELVAARLAAGQAGPGGRGMEAGGACGAGGVGQSEPRRVREALSLLPAVEAPWPGNTGWVTAADLRPVLEAALAPAVDAVRGLLAEAGPAPVLLIGGVARTPVLAELLDAAGVADVTVAPRPEAAAVLGALALPPDAGEVAPREAHPATPSRHWLGPPPRKRFRPFRVAVLAVVAAAAVAALLAAGRSLAPPGSPAAGVLVQYGYRLDLPAGWEHTGGLPERRRVLLTPASAPDGSDLIAVERTSLGYDTGAEPERARAELYAEFATAVAAGSRLSGYDPDARVAGRGGVAYRQEEAGGTVVEWFVVLDGDAQLSVGCRHTSANADAVRAACARVVASVGRE